ADSPGEVRDEDSVHLEIVGRRNDSRKLPGVSEAASGRRLCSGRRGPRSGFVRARDELIQLDYRTMVIASAARVMAV
ncbi:MAG TPA: hypothetical protein VGA77_09045, partial [Propylenella sp.]